MLLAAIVVPLVVLAASRPTVGRTPAHASPSATSRPVFQFAPAVVHISTLGRTNAADASQAAAARIRTALSAFYDQAFLDPRTWAQGVPPPAWNIFSPSLRPRAEGDVASLALGAQVPTLARLFDMEASLSVRVLVGPLGGIAVAAADVRFAARGSLKDGRAVQLTNQASFLFRPVLGRWMIVGYPTASTEVNAAPSPASPTTSGVSPSPNASGAAP